MRVLSLSLSHTHTHTHTHTQRRKEEGSIQRERELTFTVSIWSRVHSYSKVPVSVFHSIVERMSCDEVYDVT